VISDYEVPNDVYYAPEMTRLRDLAGEVVCIANDLLSYDRETSLGSPLVSLPRVLAHDGRLTHEQAKRRALDLHDRAIAEFVKLESSVRNATSGSAHRLVDDLRSWIWGNLHWSRANRRYAQAGEAAS
jgi:hypothetical protein